MKLKTKIFTAVIGLCFVFSSSLFALDNRAEESLARGKRLFADGRYEEAMDSFIDVFVSGNTDQISEANEYVNLIHFDRGGVVTPKQVPYEEEIAKRQNLGVQGRNLFDKAPKQQETTVNEKQEPWKEVFVREPEFTLAEPPDSVPEADPFGYQKRVEEEKQRQEAEAAQKEAEEKAAAEKAAAKAEEAAAKAEIEAAEKAQKAKEKEEAANIPEAGNENNALYEGMPVSPDVETETVYIVKQPDAEEVEEEVAFPRGSKARVRSLQKKKNKQQRQEMIDEVIARLNANEDVEVYMRGGRIDAIDIASSAIFTGRYTLGNKGDKILNDVYSLMILENSPAYVILPEGSYSDDVTLQNVRQAIAFNSYLIDRGISPAKMSLNMGFTPQEPPEKFSNLAGLSVVFDYDGKTRLKSKLSEKNLAPVLSLAVYPFTEITPGAGETFVIDFSVMEGTSPIKKWNLQIVSHAADDHYYVVKQLSGTGALTNQFFWNGRKRFFGHILPLGKYTIVLRATDTVGRERLVKRQVILKAMPKKKSNVVIKTEEQVLKEEKIKQEKAAKEAAKKAQAENNARTWAELQEKQKTLDFKQKRLWTRPSRIKKSGVIEDDVTVTKQETTVSSYSETSSGTQESGEGNTSSYSTSNSYTTENSEDIDF